jgi:hypothetical protein
MGKCGKLFQQHFFLSKPFRILVLTIGGNRSLIVLTVLIFSIVSPYHLFNFKSTTMRKLQFTPAEETVWNRITLEQKRLMVRFNMQYIVKGYQTNTAANWDEFLTADDTIVGHILTSDEFAIWDTITDVQKGLVRDLLNRFIEANEEALMDVWEGRVPASWNENTCEYNAIDYDFSEIALQELFQTQGLFNFTFLNNNK